MEKGVVQPNPIQNFSVQILSATVGALLLTGCFTTNFTSFSNNGLIGNGNSLNNIGDSQTGNGGDFLINVTNIVRSNINPAALFDIVGDGTGSIGQYCISTGVGGTTKTTGDIGTNGPSTCTCEYSYISSNGASQSFEVDTSYVETDLLRCPLGGIPLTASSVNIRVHAKTAGVFSNSVTYKFSGSGALVDLSKAGSYSQVQRYQCKDAVFVPFLLDGNIYDPFTSDAPDISYPLNFYATNMGRAISDYVGAGFALPNNGAGYVCPTMPNDSSAGLDLTMYSIYPDGQASKRIYPPGNSAFDRANFYLAKAPAGVFSVPFNVFEAPNTVTSAPDPSTGQTSGNPPSIGYAAASIPLGQGQERCPNANDGVVIPTGYQWVKVWQFRASLSSRTVSRSQSITGATVSVACNAGTFASGTAVTPDCGTNGGITSDPTGGRIADRVLGTGVCVNLSGANQNVSPGCSSSGNPFCLPLCNDKIPATGVGCTTLASTGTQKVPNGVLPNIADYSVFAPGTDIWRPAGPRACSGAVADNLNLCFANYAKNPNPAGAVPFDNTPPVNLNIDGNVSRFDIVYVVSPTTVMSQNFQSATTGIADAVGLVYTPYRFYSPVFCQSPDPDNPQIFPDGSRDCSTDKKIVYGFQNTDATAVQTGSTAVNKPIFPMCALQPTQ